MLLDLKRAGEISDYTYKMLYNNDVHAFMAYLKFINREFHWDLSSLLLILQLMQFLVILREFVACCWEYLFHCQKFTRICGFQKR